MIKDWSMNQVLSEISKIAYAEKDFNMTGFVTWGCKQELYRILWYIEDCLDNCSTYGEDEKEFLKSREQQKLLKALGKK